MITSYLTNHSIHFFINQILLKIDSCPKREVEVRERGIIQQWDTYRLKKHTYLHLLPARIKRPLIVYVSFIMDLVTTLYSWMTGYMLHRIHSYHLGLTCLHHVLIGVSCLKSTSLRMKTRLLFLFQVVYESVRYSC